MATDPTDHPLHKVPEDLPRPPGDLPPGNTPPASPAQPGGASRPPGPGPYSGEIENEDADPVGAPPRM